MGLMQASLQQLQSASSPITAATAAALSSDLAQLRLEVQELIKFVALNYLAVVKAIKKRNRHLRVGAGAGARREGAKDLP